MLVVQIILVLPVLVLSKCTIWSDTQSRNDGDFILVYKSIISRMVAMEFGLRCELYGHSDDVRMILSMAMFAS